MYQILKIVLSFQKCILLTKKSKNVKPFELLERKKLTQNINCEISKITNIVLGFSLFFDC